VSTYVTFKIDNPKSHGEAAKRPHPKRSGKNWGFSSDDLPAYGHDQGNSIAEVSSTLCRTPDAKLNSLVTAITPTPAGEGKTNTNRRLGDGLDRIG